MENNRSMLPPGFVRKNSNPAIPCEIINGVAIYRHDDPNKLCVHQHNRIVTDDGRQLVHSKKGENNHQGVTTKGISKVQNNNMVTDCFQEVIDVDEETTILVPGDEYNKIFTNGGKQLVHSGNGKNNRLGVTDKEMDVQALNRWADEQLVEPCQKSGDVDQELVVIESLGVTDTEMYLQALSKWADEQLKYPYQRSIAVDQELVLVESENGEKTQLGVTDKKMDLQALNRLVDEQLGDPYQYVSNYGMMQNLIDSGMNSSSELMDNNVTSQWMEYTDNDIIDDTPLWS